jgi:PBSX family phage terminase large subunit
VPGPTGLTPVATRTPRATYKPLPWQVRPFRDNRALVMLLTGSAGGGKSRLAAEKLHGYCMKYDGAMALALRKTRESMVNSTVLVLERKILAQQGIKHNQQKSRFEYPNGSILAYGGMKDDTQREHVRSIGQDGGLDIAWMEEANRFTEEDFNEILARMRGKAAPWRQVILTTNPDTPAHWIYKRLITGGEAAVYYSGAVDNPHNAPEYLETLAKMTGVQGERLNRGRWVQAEGAVWPEFDPAVHLIDPFPVPKAWRRIRVVDFGYTNPFVCQWWAVDPDGRMFRYRETYHTRRLVEDHVLGVRDENGNVLKPGINQLSAGERFEATVCDHDAEDRATFERHADSSTVAAYKAVTPGIEAVAARLRAAGDGKPRLFLFRDALVERDATLDQRRRPLCTEEEVPGYVWAPGPDGKASKEEPLKLDDHGCDAMRYAVAYEDGMTGRVELTKGYAGAV